MIQRDKLYYEYRLARLMTNPVENANLIHKVRRQLRKQKQINILINNGVKYRAVICIQNHELLAESSNSVQ